jgi:putative ABC transport system ATP-binding protein
MTPDAPVLEMRGVTKSFATTAGRVDVLRGVDLAVRRGDFVAITGPSGSGKSTLLNLAALLDRPTSGEVCLDGQDVTRLDDESACEIRKLKVGMVFQQFHLLPRRSVRENVLFRFRYTDRAPDETGRAAEFALDAVGLSAIAQRAARLLSGGEMQRVAIARAIALRPALLVADEPTGNLDRASAEGVMDCFTRMNRAGLTILLVTHNEHLLHYCTRHLACRDGRVEECALAPAESDP